MHIAFLTPEYPHPKIVSSAGIGTSVKNLVDALVKKGNEVSVFVYQQNTSEVFKQDNITIHLIAKKRFKICTWYYYRKHVQKYITTIISKEHISIIEAPDWTGITAFMRFRIPLVIRFHGTDAYFCKLEQRKQKFKNFVFEKLALIGATAYISPTQYAKKETAKLFSLNEDKISVIPNGIDIEVFNNEEPNQFIEKTLLYIGTIIRKKGVFDLVGAFNNIIEEAPDATLILIGSDSADVETGSSSTYQLVQKKLSEKAKLNVKYLGKVPYSKVVTYIKKAHICVFPSYAETFGMVTVECMAMHKPVVNTNIGWANEIIDDDINGYLIHPSETMVYKDRILTLFKDKPLCLNVGKSARQKAESTFNIDIIAEKNIHFYRSVISESKY
ncbi:Glycosyltransferase involved in cell wall bisynthesis [Hyunsoonleella jejuensis]|uniref:Glycosyltransferase involved in cell wall bisynthesis n=1 Tax=Hyunsoonleella jejuensis TaxID=419940 RepID=A0A1H9D8P1_9FLAO|nr:glycosyltransferase family 4 protein [Hyunsoonleella jejuensis]SEQ09834.1 Glycosyltransferase involved in cell wall bisynthesis [Hyunsoonleella jejuensis]